MIELITGHAGENHIDAEDVRACNRGTFGSGNYLLEGSKSEKITPAMTVKIPALELMLDGSHFRTDGTDKLTFQATAQGSRRVDCIVARYLNNGGIETAELAIVEKTALVNTFNRVDYPLYECTVSGGSVSSITCVLTKLKSIGTIASVDVTPVKSGGTGATSVSGARKNLGLDSLWYVENFIYDGADIAVGAGKTTTISIGIIAKSGYKPVAIAGYKITKPVSFYGNASEITVNNITVTNTGINVELASTEGGFCGFEARVLFLKDI